MLKVGNLYERRRPKTSGGAAGGADTTKRRRDDIIDLSAGNGSSQQTVIRQPARKKRLTGTAPSQQTTLSFQTPTNTTGVTHTLNGKSQAQLNNCILRCVGKYNLHDIMTILHYCPIVYPVVMHLRIATESESLPGSFLLCELRAWNTQIIKYTPSDEQQSSLVFTSLKETYGYVETKTKLAIPSSLDVDLKPWAAFQIRLPIPTAPGGLVSLLDVISLQRWMQLHQGIPELENDLVIAPLLTSEKTLLYGSDNVLRLPPQLRIPVGHIKSDWQNYETPFMEMLTHVADYEQIDRLKAGQFIVLFYWERHIIDLVLSRHKRDSQLLNLPSWSFTFDENVPISNSQMELESGIIETS